MPWNTADTYTSGQILTAASLNKVTEDVNIIGAAWTAYTPTWTGVTVGNATQDSAYIKFGRMVFVRMRFTLGSTSSITGNPSFTLPATAASYFDDVQYATVGTCGLLDGGTAYNGFLLANTTTSVILATLAGSTLDADKNMTLVAATQPFTWGNGDSFSAHFFYEAATA